MEQKTMKNIKKVENQLVSLLKADEKLAKDQKMSYLAIANLFLENFDKNIDKTSIELNKDIPIGIDTWKEFLNYPGLRLSELPQSTFSIFQKLLCGLMLDSEKLNYLK